MGHIIAVAGPIGSGKSTLVRGIAQELGDASTLFYDSYEQTSRKAPRDIIRWMQEGADFNAFLLTELADDLSALKRGLPIIDPVSGKRVASEKYIIFEMPLGKEHQATSPFIDLLLWIDIPLDIALARKIREYTAEFLAEGNEANSRERLDWLKGFLDNYLVLIRPLLKIQVERVCPNADIIIDGKENPKLMINHACKEILTRLPRK